MRGGGGALSPDSLRVADLACGTGTLLSAAYQSILSRHRRLGRSDSSLHKIMMEKSLIATDIMPVATHLTTSMLSSAHPTTVFGNTCIYTIPYGAQEDDRDIAIGSLDLLDKDHGTDLFGTGIRSIRGHEADSKVHNEIWAHEFSLRHETLDIVIMNPPFTRPTNHKVADVPIPSFAGFQTSDEEQRLMKDKLASIQKKKRPRAGNGNAGLASHFLDLAHVKLRTGGTLAMVMPLALIQGSSWANSRDLLAKCYDRIVFVTIAANKSVDAAFSADTNMGEVLVIASKGSLKENRTEEDACAYFVTLRRRPRTRAEAIEYARIIHNAVEIGDAQHRLRLGDELAGIMCKAPVASGGCASVADPELVDVALKLEEGKLSFPSCGIVVPLPTTTLGNLGRVGALHRDISEENRGPFAVWDIDDKTQPTYPVLWNHHAERERRMIVAPDKWATIRPQMADKARSLWRRATNLHFTLDFGLGSQCLAACWTRDVSIGGRAWPNFSVADESHAKAILLWANTTLGLLLFWWIGNKQHVGRALVTIQRLPSLTTFDPREMDSRKKMMVEKIFQEFSSQTFLPASEAFRDDTRMSLDKAILVDLLELPSSLLPHLDSVRKKWCYEPTVWKT